MSQNDFNLANQGFPQMRADMNSAFQALASNSSGATAPSTTYAYQMWYDETADLLKMRNSDNDAWITLAAFDQTADEWELRSAVIQAVDSAGVVIKTDDGTTRVTVADSGNVTLANDLVVTGTVQASNISATGSMSSRNKIINGAMVIDQRNAGAAVTPTNGQYAPDRWRAELTQASKYSVQQVADAPAGFVNSLKVTSLSAYSVTSSDQFNVRQAIEGFNVADLNYGTANAQSVTVSFWVKSSLTGTFGASLTNSDNTMLYNFNYTINSADTWEYKTHTAVGPTTGTWQATDGAGIFLRFNLGLGSTFASTTVGSWVSGADLVGNPNATSVVATNGATWQITGVQLEAGDTATPFEHRSYGQELALCERYYQVLGRVYYSNSYDATTTLKFVTPTFKTEMRATPTADITRTYGNGANFSGTIVIAITPSTIWDLQDIDAASGVLSADIKLSAEL